MYAGAGSAGKVLCYGRVARDVRPEQGMAVFKVPVEVSTGQFAELLSSQVYSFRSGSTATGSQPGSDADPDSAIGHADLHPSGDTRDAPVIPSAPTSSPHREVGCASLLLLLFMLSSQSPRQRRNTFLPCICLWTALNWRTKNAETDGDHHG